MRFSQLIAGMLSLTITAIAIPTALEARDFGTSCGVSDPEDTFVCDCWINASVDAARTAKCCPTGHVDEVSGECIKLTDEQSQDFVYCCRNSQSNAGTPSQMQELPVKCLMTTRGLRRLR